MRFDQLAIGKNKQFSTSTWELARVTINNVCTLFELSVTRLEEDKYEARMLVIVGELRKDPKVCHQVHEGVYTYDELTEYRKVACIHVP